jgi:hypothetical protein
VYLPLLEGFSDGLYVADLLPRTGHEQRLHLTHLQDSMQGGKMKGTVTVLFATDLLPTPALAC